MSRMRIWLDTNLTQKGLEGKIKLSDKDNKWNSMQDVINYCKGVSNGDEGAKVNIMLGSGTGVAASGTVTIASSGAQSVTINGKALVGGTDYVIASKTVTEIAANIVSAIKASSDSRIQAVTASSSAGVVTVSANDPGTIGNMYTTTATGAASAGQATLASGADATQHAYKFNVS